MQALSRSPYFVGPRRPRRRKSSNSCRHVSKWPPAHPRPKTKTWISQLIKWNISRFLLCYSRLQTLVGSRVHHLHVTLTGGIKAFTSIDIYPRLKNSAGVRSPAQPGEKNRRLIFHRWIDVRVNFEKARGRVVSFHSSGERLPVEWMGHDEKRRLSFWLALDGVIHYLYQ